jgi:tetratricopeptide (TPR) repeat protein
MNNLGQLREDQGNHERAGTLYHQAYELDRRILGPDHPKTLIPLNNLVRILQSQNKTEILRPLVAERIAHLRRAAQLPDASALTLHAYAWELLNCDLEELRNPDRALPVAREAVEKNGGINADLLETLAVAYHRTGNLDLAIETQRRAVTRAQTGELYSRTRMEDRLRDYLLESGNLGEAFNFSWERLTLGLGGWVVPEEWLPSKSLPDEELIQQSEALIREGRYLQAAAVLRGCLAMRRKALPEGHWLITDIKSRLGAAIAGEGKFVEAEPLLLGAYSALKGDSQAAADSKQKAVERIIRLYESWKKQDRVSEWQKKLEEEEGDTGGE